MNAKTEFPLRVDFAGSWLDVPSLARTGAYIVNCAIQPLVSLERWGYEQNSGLGGSAAWAALNGADPIASDLKAAGWQDPAVILETGLCVWRSGQSPVLEAKFNPDWLTGLLALLHTGIRHNTSEAIGRPRDYEKIENAALAATRAAHTRSIMGLAEALQLSYEQQLEEGMTSVEMPGYGCLASKYCGSGYGGYIVCLFRNAEGRDSFVQACPGKALAIEPYFRHLCG